MIRRLDVVWYWLLCRVHRWIGDRVLAWCRRDRVRREEAEPRGRAVRRLQENLARQKAHLN
jgi:hypothetical protein